jgi:hypothetical protein
MNNSRPELSGGLNIIGSSSGCGQARCAETQATIIHCDEAVSVDVCTPDDLAQSVTSRASPMTPKAAAKETHAASATVAPRPNRENTTANMVGEMA